jgi:hypothetical protein
MAPPWPGSWQLAAFGGALPAATPGGNTEVIVLRGALAEVLCLVGFDAIFMALRQEGYFHQIKKGILVSGVVLFGASLVQVWRLSAPRRLSQTRDIGGRRPFVDDVLPRCLFSDKFRQQMHDELTTPGTSRRGGSSWSQATEERELPEHSLPHQSSSPEFQLPPPDVPIVTAVDVHGHLHCNFKRALVLGGAQLLLIAHYVGGSVVRGPPCFGIRSVYEFYWTGAVLKACYIAGTDVLAAPWYSLAFWWQVLWWARRADEKSPWTLVLADEAIRAGTTTTHTRTAASPPRFSSAVPLYMDLRRSCEGSTLGCALCHELACQSNGFDLHHERPTSAIGLERISRRLCHQCHCRLFYLSTGRPGRAGGI